MVAVESLPEIIRGVQWFGSSGLKTLSEYADISSAAAADLYVERPNILDLIEGTVDTNLMSVTPIESVPTKTAVTELVEAPTNAEAASSDVPPVTREVIIASFLSQSYSMEGTTKADKIMDEIAVFVRDITSSVTSL